MYVNCYDQKIKRKEENPTIVTETKLIAVIEEEIKNIKLQSP